MSYAIAVLSHRRPEVWRDYTLTFLYQSGADMSRLHLFLSDEQDAQDYAPYIPIGSTVVLCPDARNATQKFNAIYDYFVPGKKVFVLEDDVRLIRGEKGVNEKIPVTDLDALVRRGFDAARGGLWGVTPHDNAFMFQKRVTYSMNLVVAHAFGFTASEDPWFRVTLPSKTDYERTIRYFIKFGYVCRIPGYGVEAAKSYRLEGGMQADHSTAQRMMLEERSVEYLVHRYPHLACRKQKENSEYAELRLRNPPRKMELHPDFLYDYQKALDKQLGYLQ